MSVESNTRNKQHSERIKMLMKVLRHIKKLVMDHRQTNR